MTVRLTYDEYKKAEAAGFHSGSACACMGPQGEDEWCPCSMNFLDKIVPEDHSKIFADWKAKGYLSRSERGEATILDWDEIWAERDGRKDYDGKYDPPKSVYRDRRLALIARKKEEQAF